MKPIRPFTPAPCPRFLRSAAARLAGAAVAMAAAGCLPAAAQYDPAFAHYWDVEQQYNPAAVGRSPQLHINAAYQSHASGFEDAGGTMYAGANMALQFGKTRHGVGAMFQNDEIGLFSSKRFALQYAFHLKLFGGQLSIGAEADMLNESVDGTKADLGEANDPAFPSSEVSGSKFDASVGLYYAHGPWHAALSMLHVTSPTVYLGETNERKIDALYNFTGGYNIRTRNPLLTIAPSVMLRYGGGDFRADVSARAIFENGKKRFYGGASYSPQHSVTLLVGGAFHGVDISYGYEANTSGMGIGSGNHEVTLSYRLDLNLGKKGRNKHKSVRFL